MLETELFALLEHTADVAYTVTERGEIRSWNAAAERLLGYRADEVLGRNIDDVLEARDALGTNALAGRAEAAARRWDRREPGGIPDFDLEVRSRTGARLWINVSTIVFVNPRTGRRLFARLARDITARRRRDELASRMLDIARQLAAMPEDARAQAPVETLTDQERRILRLFADGGNAGAIARTLRISAQTLRNHLHRINRKLRTHNRLEAVIHAQLRGLLDDVRPRGRS